ncbi:hypothetical protein ABVT39_008308 [Epinephelus coioides]
MYALKENVPADFIYKWTPTTIFRRTDNPVLTHIIKMWHEVRKKIGLKNIFSPKTPLKQNELIPMSVDNKILETSHQKGIRHLEDCYKDGCLMSFEDLRRKYDLSSRIFFCYLQLRSFLKSVLGPEMTLPMLSDLERLLHEDKIMAALQRIGVAQSTEQKASPSTRVGRCKVYHSMYLKYLPQRTHFGYDVMIHASMLAALDHNNNANREQAALQDGENVGEPKFKISWSKVHKRFRAKPVAVQKDYGYMKAMVADVLSSVSDSNHGMDIRLNQTHIMAPPERPSRSHIISKTEQFSCIKQLDFSRVCVTLQIKMFVLMKASDARNM